MVTNFDVFFINLDNREDRLFDIKKNLREHKFKNIKKFSAVPHEYGEIGCAKSHLALLSHIFTKINTDNYVIILEDDYRFNIDEKQLIDAVNKILEEKIQFDVLQIHVLNPIVTEIGNLQIRSQDISVARVLAGSSTAAYMVSADFIPKLMNCFSKSVEILDKNQTHFFNKQLRTVYNHKFAIDNIWRELQALYLFVCLDIKIGQIDSSSTSDIKQGNPKELDVYGSKNLWLKE
ncbi:glycosyltransferase family 25 protein [Alphaproteobacteria bacterium]|nr:glycosyltransferase family 25 protein [Alphaproteobacteria bacterium]